MARRQAPPASATAPRRRQALALSAALALGILLGWALFGREANDSKPAVASTTSTAPAAGVPAKVSLTKASYPKMGLTFGRPPGWTASEQSGVVKLSTTDSTVSLAISNSGAPGREKEVRRFDQDQLLKLFKPARVLGRQRGKIGTLPALSTEIAGTTKRRRPIRILSTAAATQYRTYSVQVFSTPRPPAARLIEVRAILDSFRFTKPS